MGNKNQKQQTENVVTSTQQVQTKHFVDKQYKKGYQQIQELKKGDPKKHLELHYQHYEQSLESVQYFCDTIIQLSCLQKLTLDFRYFQIEGQAASTISSALAKCKNLTYLDLQFQQNLIDKQQFDQIIEQISNCNKLETLKLFFGQNLIEDFQAQSLEQTLKSLPNLQVFAIDIINNKLSEQGAVNVSNAIAQCPKIKNVYLGFRKTFKFSEDFFGFNFKGFSKIQELTIFLDENSIDQQKAKMLGDNISCCSSLNNLTLSLTQNQINLVGSIYLLEGLIKCKQLVNLTLRISSNGIPDEQLYKISKTLKGLQSTTILEITLGVQKNTLSYKKIKLELFKLKRLAQFYLY
ncbi:amine-terminal domain enolase (macronuclear) [Tetrahymena thermophila SB210]|uniref:Amine-terminal domain enolase n=1 Tax=Tetrahymena thermophila (strain SB210) TaxID=312017 RepID=W7X6P3_TETTS|nr:amine-terminal domain enolase [Tetrahymena thermophila SB210]EWS72048.1 amine-terminal domain enolase [Tetrahymena thermophila SB210]|eukprot:XP_012655423.1 amine-terminal domain enolase [Tetrahymena thermophila SB210]